MNINTIEYSNPNILRRAFDTTRKGFVNLFDVVAKGLDSCGRKVENLAYHCLPPTAAKIVIYILGALPVVALWAVTLVTPFYISLPLIAIYSLAVLSKKNTISTKAAININNGDGIGMTLAAMVLLKNLKNAPVHPVFTITLIALDIFFAGACFTRSLQLMRADLKEQKPVQSHL